MDDSLAYLLWGFVAFFAVYLLRQLMSGNNSSQSYTEKLRKDYDLSNQSSFEFKELDVNEEVDEDELQRAIRESDQLSEEQKTKIKAYTQNFSKYIKVFKFLFIIMILAQFLPIF